MPAVFTSTNTIITITNTIWVIRLLTLVRLRRHLPYTIHLQRDLTRCFICHLHRRSSYRTWVLTVNFSIKSLYWSASVFLWYSFNPTFGAVCHFWLTTLNSALWYHDEILENWWEDEALGDEVALLETVKILLMNFSFCKIERRINNVKNSRRMVFRQGLRDSNFFWDIARLGREDCIHLFSLFLKSFSTFTCGIEFVPKSSHSYRHESEISPRHGE